MSNTAGMIGISGVFSANLENEITPAVHLMSGVLRHPNKYSLINPPCRHAEVGGGATGVSAGVAAPAGAGVTSGSTVNTNAFALDCNRGAAVCSTLAPLNVLSV